MREKRTQGRPVLVRDVAVTLYYYLMFINIAGVHGYAAIGAHPEYHAPPVPEMLQEAQAQVRTYQGRMPPGPEPTRKERRTLLDARARDLLGRLDAFEATLASDKPAPARWDEMIHVAEQARLYGERMAQSAKPLERAKKKLGVEISIRAAQVEAHIAKRISLIHGGPGPFRWKFEQPERGPLTNFNN